VAAAVTAFEGGQVRLDLETAQTALVDRAIHALGPESPKI
jgi:hypothetical protein